MDTALPQGRLGKLREGWRRFRHYGKGGDFALLKADALGAHGRAEIEQRLEAVRGYLPPIDIKTLSWLPPGSFGRAYARHMQENGLKPFTISDDLREVAERNVFAARYAATHDMVHVLLGFDVSLAGEIGVQAFAAAQGYSRGISVGLGIASVLYPAIRPWRAGRIARARRHGRKAAEGAVFLLAEKLEERWEERLLDVRRSLRLPLDGAPRDAGGRPAGLSG